MTNNTKELLAYPAHTDLENWYYQRNEGFGQKAPKFDNSFLINEHHQLLAQVKVLTDHLASMGDGWQDISSAPRDGSHVIVAYKSDSRGWQIKEAWWGMAYEGAPPIQCSWRTDGNRALLDKFYHGIGASHWQLLPQPPENS